MPESTGNLKMLPHIRKGMVSYAPITTEWYKSSHFISGCTVIIKWTISTMLLTVSQVHCKAVINFVLQCLKWRNIYQMMVFLWTFFTLVFSEEEKNLIGIQSNIGEEHLFFAVYLWSWKYLITASFYTQDNSITVSKALFKTQAISI